MSDERLGVLETEMQARRLMTVIRRNLADSLDMIAAGEYNIELSGRASGLVVQGQKIDKKTQLMQQGQQQIQVACQLVDSAKEAMRDFLKLSDQGGNGPGPGPDEKGPPPKPPLRMADLAGTNGRHG